jgi:hypothetical protein
MTRGDEFLQAIEQALGTLLRLSYGAYARRDVSAVIDPLGSRLESFLRTTVLPMASHNDNFYQLIEALIPAGLAASHAGELHSLRQLYNRSKHSPSESLPLAEAIDALQRAADAIAAIGSLGLGIGGLPYERAVNYHLYVAFWDHFTAGETEVVVAVPGDNWTHITLVDTLSMKGNNWETLKPLLLSHPQFRLGQEHFRPEVWKTLTEEGSNFLTAGVWDGDYGELIRLLAPFDDRAIAAELIPDLRRDQNPTSVAIALIVAAVDVARATSATLSEDDLAERILDRADNQYAMPRDGQAVKAGATQIAALIRTLSFDQWCHLVGPVLAEADVGAAPALGPFPIKLDGTAVMLGYRK